MRKQRIFAVFFLILGLGLAYQLLLKQNTKDFTYGLDIQGGIELTYGIDTSQLGTTDDQEIQDATGALRDVITRRIDAFGVAEPRVRIASSRLSEGEGKQYQMLVELPGIEDLDQAVEMIGQTPLLEFRLENPDYQTALNEAFQASLEQAETTPQEGEDGEQGIVVQPDIDFDSLPEQYTDTGLTGRFLKRSSLQFTQTGAQHSGGFAVAPEPFISLTFDQEGADLFEQITTDNTGRVLAIFLDGNVISAPVIQTAIPNGEAIVTGQFTPEEAKQLVGRLNSGALPLPITLLSTQSIGPSLGAQALQQGVTAGLIGFALVGIFLIAWYRLPGLLATLALSLYALGMLAVFKYLPVTLTTAGIAGFIMSLGIAVDANILIFERTKEEIKDGSSLSDAIKSGFSRAWISIRDANLSSLISAIILFWFGTSLIQGFALTFGIGVMLSMVSAVTVTRIFMTASAGTKTTKRKKFLFSSGFTS